MSGPPSERRRGPGERRRGPEERRRARIRRVLVALDASEDSLAALEASVELAAAVQAELLGLFVEDQHLMRMAEIPFTREIDMISGSRRDFRRAELERQLRAQAARARHWLARHADRRGVRWAFRTARGEVAGALLEALAAEDADLAIVGATGRSLRRRPGSTVRALLLEAPRPVLVLRRGGRLGRRVHLVWDGSEAADRALDLVEPLLADERAGLTVLALGTPESCEKLAEGVEEELRERGLEARVVRLAAPDRTAREARVLALARREGPGLLVVPRHLLGDDPADAAARFAEIRTPLLVVGGEGS